LAGVAGSDDGTGSAAKFHNPVGIAIDSAGNIFVADSYNHTIRKIDATTLEVTTFAGTAGAYGSANGIGLTARFNNPFGIAIDSSDNLFVTDQSNYTIRKIRPDRFVSTFAGSTGVFGLTDGTGSSARFGSLFGIAIDNSDNLYVGDNGSYTIRKVTSLGVVTTFAGTTGISGSADGTGTAARFSFYQYGLTVDSSGNILVTDYVNHTIRKMTQGGVVTTIAGTAGVDGSDDGTGSAARFYNPSAIVVDSSGNIFVTDANLSIRKIQSESIVTTLPSSNKIYEGAGTVARFMAPRDVALDSHRNLFVLDGHCIRKITPAGVVATFAGSATVSGNSDATGTAARFYSPKGIAIDSHDNLFVTEPENHTIRKITPQRVVTTFAGSNGARGSDDGTGSAARFFYPQGIAIDSSDNLFVVDTYNYIIRKITPAGVVTTFAGTLGTQGIVDDTGLAAAFYQPQDLTVDQDGNIFVADFNNDDQYPYIRKITPVGVVTTVAGGDRGFADGPGVNATFGGTSLGITSDKAGNLYIADTDNHLIRKIDSSFNVTTMAGSPTQQYGRDNGVGTAATFRGPLGLAVDPAGYLYVADTENRTIRKID
jgi:streptogramin lyase